MLNRFNTWPTGVKIASAALVVNTARYILVFLTVDGVTPWPWLKTSLDGASALATGIVLTGGGVYVAHAVAVSRGSGWRYWIKFTLLVMSWLALLGFAVILLAPALVAGIRGATLAQVLPWPLDAVWAIVAVTAVEVLAGAAVLAESLKQPVRAITRATIATPPPAPVAPPAPASEPSDTLSSPSVALPVAISLACPDCGALYRSQNALNAHRAKCKMRQAVAVTAPSVNGHHAA